MKYLLKDHGDFYSLSVQIVGLPTVGLVNQVAIENCKLQFSHRIGRFCTRRCHLAGKKLDDRWGA